MIVVCCVTCFSCTLSFFHISRKVFRMKLFMSVKVLIILHLMYFLSYHSRFENSLLKDEILKKKDGFFCLHFVS